MFLTISFGKYCFRRFGVGCRESGSQSRTKTFFSADWNAFRKLKHATDVPMLYFLKRFLVCIKKSPEDFFRRTNSNCSRRSNFVFETRMVRPSRGGGTQIFRTRLSFTYFAIPVPPFYASSLQFGRFLRVPSPDRAVVGRKVPSKV